MGLLVLLIVGPIVELYTAIQVSHLIGGWNTIALLVVMGLVGSWLLKRQGISIVARARKAMAEGHAPDTELVDGILLAIAAGLMIVPGFISTAVGLLLLIPPTRALVRPLVRRRLGARGTSRVTVVGDGRYVGAFRMNDRGVYDVGGHDARPEPRTPPRELEP